MFETIKEHARAPPSIIVVMARQQYFSAVSYIVRLYSWYRSIIDYLPVNAAESTRQKRPANRHENRISCWPQSENIYNDNMSKSVNAFVQKNTQKGHVQMHIKANV